MWIKYIRYIEAMQKFKDKQKKLHELRNKGIK